MKKSNPFNLTTSKKNVNKKKEQKKPSYEIKKKKNKKKKLSIKKEKNLQSQNKTKKKILKKIKKTKKKMIDLQLRSQAIIANNIKNTNQEIKKINLIITINFFKTLIPIIDALEKLKKNKYQSLIKKKSIKKGISLTRKLFLNNLKKLKVKSEKRKKIPFDPKIHKIIKKKKTNTMKSNYIFSIIKKGYYFSKIILRKAHVIISK